MTENRKPETGNRFSTYGDWLLVLGLALAGAALFFWRLGAPGLMDPDEGRYAEIAREFFVTGNWLIPHLNFVPYLEKPPLLYWLTALGFGALGWGEAAARLPSAASAVVGLFLAYALGRAFWGPTAGLAGALVLGSAAGYLAMGRLLTPDMVFALFLNLGMGLGYLAASRDRPRLWPWAYGALALATLVKGPVALVLAGLTWGGWALLSRRALRVFVRPRSWLLYAVITLPWFLWVQGQYPEFLRYFLLEHHVARFLTAEMHPQPPYYFLPVLLGLMLPWSWLLPWSLGRRPGSDPDRRFLLLWAGVVLVFFSLSRGKLPSYILPALLPLALLLGASLADPERGGRGLKLSLAAWALAGWGLLLMYLWGPPFLAQGLARLEPFRPYLALGLVLFALTPSAALAWRRRDLLLAGALLLSILAPLWIEGVSLQRSPRSAGLALKAVWQPGQPLVGIGIYSPGLSFYSGQPFHLLLDLPGELDFGRSLKPASPLFFPGPQVMAAFVRDRPRVFFFLKLHSLSSMEGLLPGTYAPVGRYKDCLLAAYEGK